MLPITALTGTSSPKDLWRELRVRWGERQIYGITGLRHWYSHCLELKRSGLSICSWPISVTLPATNMQTQALRHLDTSGSTTAAQISVHQSRSPLLRLPGKLGNAIYIYVLTDAVVHINMNRELADYENTLSLFLAFKRTYLERS
ncbi:hypothetical protein CC80DRAFT_170385 [Byssothecium circinans]|uniref:Uncharacterized protein n=1 Tax=Byssothecium circinans TaxID=147558 RepID=A0A6A5TAU6_9PLEO|nr:hypothetical protein CC80DRAFT_296496 [Byssothecium circinans]KAF1952806.1 hypothetical protein CC80DRAFT_170385 [Byssothecium circinans]